MSKQIAFLVPLCLLATMSLNLFADEDSRREASARRDRGDSFEPANDRERVLFQMINALRDEVASLRHQLESRRDVGARDGNARYADRDGTPSPRLRDGDRGSESPEARRGDRDQPRSVNNRLLQQAKRIFAAYDKNRDQSVSFEEWLQMREGEMTSERRERERGHFDEPAGEDSKITLEEFYRWMESRQRGAARREGDQSASRERDRPSSREGDRRDGDRPASRESARDGDRPSESRDREG